MSELKRKNNTKKSYPNTSKTCARHVDTSKKIISLEKKNKKNKKNSIINDRDQKKNFLTTQALSDYLPTPNVNISIDNQLNQAINTLSNSITNASVEVRVEDSAKQMLEKVIDLLQGASIPTEFKVEHSNPLMTSINEGFKGISKLYTDHKLLVVSVFATLYLFKESDKLSKSTFYPILGTLLASICISQREQIFDIIQKFTGDSNEEEIIETQGPFEWDDVVSLIVSFGSMSFPDISCPKSAIKTFISETKDFSKKKEGMVDFISTALGFFQRLVNWFRTRLLGMKEINLLGTGVVAVQTWRDSVIAVTENYRKGKFPIEQDNYDYLVSLDQQGMDLASRSYTGTEAIRVRTCVNLYRDALKPILTFFGSSCLSGLGPRTEPLGVIFIGPSAVGKSALTQPLIVDVLGHIVPEERKKAFETEPYSFIYSRNAEHVFWDGYHGQMVCVYDDFGQVVDTPGTDSEALSIIRAINPFPFSVHMADLKSKGVTRFTSKIVFATSNNENIVPSTIKEAQALKRRFKFSFRVSINPKYSVKKADSNGAMQDVLDVSKIPDLDDTGKKNFFNEEVYLFERFDWGAHGHPRIGGKLYNYAEVVTMLVRGYKDRELQGNDYNLGVMQRAQRKYPIDLVTTQALDDSEHDEEILEEEPEDQTPIILDTLNKANELGYTDQIMSMMADYIIPARTRTCIKKIHPNISYRTLSGFPEARHISLKNLNKDNLTPSFVAYIETNNVVLEYIVGKAMSPLSTIPILGIRKLVRQKWPEYKTEPYAEFLSYNMECLDLTQDDISAIKFPTFHQESGYKKLIFDDLTDQQHVDLATYISYRKRDLTKHYPTMGDDLARVMESLYFETKKNPYMVETEDLSYRLIIMIYNTLILRPNDSKFRPSIFIDQVKNAQERADVTFVDWLKSKKDKFSLWYEKNFQLLETLRILAISLLGAYTVYKTFGLALSMVQKIFSNEAESEKLSNELQNYSQDQKKERTGRKGGTRKSRKTAHANKYMLNIYTESKDLDKVESISEDLEQDLIKTEGSWVDSHALAVRSIVKKNLFFLFRDSLEQSIGMCLFIKGKTVLLNRHYIWYIREKIESGLMAEGEPLYIHHESREIDIPIYLTQMIEAEKARPDLANKDLIMFDVNIDTMFPDITSHFLPNATLEKLSVVKCRLTILDGTSVQHYLTMAHKESNITATSHNKQQANIPNAFTYRIPTEAGWCGSLLFAEDKSLCGANILGIHAMGSGGIKGYATIVSREDLSTGDKGCCTQALDLPFEGNFCPIRLADKAVLAPVASSIRKTPMFGLITTNLHFPARLKPFTNNDGEYIDPLFKAITRYGLGTKEFDTQSIDLATEMYSNQLLSIDLAVPDKRKKKILSFEEAVLGIPNDNNIDSLPRNTSAGYPHNVAKTPGFNGKEFFFGKGQDYDLDRPEAIKLKEEVYEIIKHAMNGKRSEHIYTDFLKDELRSTNKIKDGSTRLISCSPIHLSIVMRMYFMSFSAFLMDENLDCDVGIGINVYGPEWSHLARKLQTKGDKIISGDFKNFDGSHVEYIQNKVLDVINSWYNGTSIENQIRRVLWLEVTNSIHICRNIIYSWNQGLSSGNVLTTTINSIYNNIVFRACWIDLIPYSHIKPTDFLHHVAIVTYGDDNILNVSDQAYDFFNQFAIQSAMAKYNLTYTNADKKRVLLNAVETINSATFLKRNFLYSDIINRYVAPLNLQVILEMTSWTQKGLLADAIARDKVDTAIAELSLHSPMVFETWIQKILDASAEHLHHRPALTTRRSLQYKLNSLISY